MSARGFDLIILVG